ncbi:MAG: ATP-binding protein [Lachnospiraceae bacterium]|nr:ATP-binding protein [Lachnospiraceae bacterium]MDY3222058.1 ATP-binding protein [Lachnospiraceae bacterium]
MREQELIVYRQLGEEELLKDMVWLMENQHQSYQDQGTLRVLCSKCIHRLLEMAGHYGFYGNLWHCYLTNLLVNNENSYSIGCEIRGSVEGSINQAVLHDITIIKEFFSYDLSRLRRLSGGDGFYLVEDYRTSSQENRVYSRLVRDRICTLAENLKESRSEEEMKETLTTFYGKYGVGRFGLHKAFRVEQSQTGTAIVPIRNIAHVYLDDLIGYEIPKKKLITNTEAFVQGRKANNCLLFGDAGTGKSSSIKAIANQYYEEGLRIIEIYKHQFQALNEVIAQIKNRNYKFIIYMDDLSFEDFETEYKYLKAVIEGGLEKKPDNVLIYATSNRRHLVREKFSDKEDRRDDLHTSDTVQEKLSLVARFGVTIYFGAPDKREFEQIVSTLAKRYGVRMQEERLLAEANKWELAHGGLSGRCAKQFIDYLLGIQEEPKKGDLPEDED